MAPVRVGLALVIGAVTLITLHWKHADKYPYAFPIIASKIMREEGRPLIETHEWYSIGYFVFLYDAWLFRYENAKGKG